MRSVTLTHRGESPCHDIPQVESVIGQVLVEHLNGKEEELNKRMG